MFRKKTKTVSYSEEIRRGEEVVPYRLVLSSRRTMEISVRPGGEVIVRAPLRAHPDDIRSRLLLRIDWIERKRKELAGRQPATPVQWTDGEEIWFLGKKYSLEKRKGLPSQKKSVSLTTSSIIVSAESKNFHTAVERWLSHEFNRIVFERLPHMVALMAPYKIPQPNIRVRKMKSRWGSCSSNGNVSLNRDLIHRSIECIDYVILHELAHFIVPNHGPRFKAILDERIPNWRELRKRMNGRD